MGSGCFWCAEAVFILLKGVIAAVPGYSGGASQLPTYKEVCAGLTGHAEVVRVDYDPKEIPFRKLLTVFFASHDPTSLSRQGNDVGTQYRSVIFYTTDEQKRAAEKMIEELNGAGSGAPGGGRPVVTEVRALEKFYEAEKYHQNFFARNPQAGYCSAVINPKLEKIRKDFKKIIKK